MQSTAIQSSFYLLRECGARAAPSLQRRCFFGVTLFFFSLLESSLDELFSAVVLVGRRVAVGAGVLL